MAPRIPSAGGEIVIAVEHGEAIGGHQAVMIDCVESTRKERPAPAVEQVAREGDVIGIPRNDATQLTVQPDHIAGGPEVKIREMCDQHLSEPEDHLSLLRSSSPCPA